MVEEIRTARRFLSEYKISKPIESLTFFELHKDTSTKDIIKYFQQIPQGVPIGIISEAGCPAIADPGSLAVAYAHKIGIDVKPLVGPSSILLALMASGFSGQSFTFHGYLPIEKNNRIAQLKKLEAESRKNQSTQLFMETPYRNNALWSDILSTCQPETLISITCNAMSDTEFIATKSIAEWKTQKIDLHKKPCIFSLFSAV